MPSGPVGKSLNSGVHEFDYKFGFEEWLRSPSSLMDNEGWKYGYIEGVFKNYVEGDENETLKLFTINCINHTRFFVGNINEWCEVTHEESTQVTQENQGLINRMRNDVAEATGNLQHAIDKFDLHANHVGNHRLFSIKFKALDFEFNDHIMIPPNSPIYALNRFWLYKNVY